MNARLNRRSFLGISLLPVIAGCGDLVEGEEPSRFEADGPTLYMTGTIYGQTPDILRAALAANPQVREIVMVEVPGSADDAANHRAGRMVRRAGLATRLLPDSLIASGGTDFFLSGRRRIVAPGAQIGVHSWSTLGGLEGAALPDSEPEHRFYLDYYREMGIPETFYWFTLAAAPSHGLHWMTRAEIARFGLATS